MNSIKPIKENVFLALNKALQDEIITEGGLKLYLDPNYNPEWNATVTGKIAELPKVIPNKYKHIYSQLNVGDEVCFSYSVVADRTFASSGALFQQVTEDNPYRKQFKNGAGETINLIAINGKISKIWIGTHHDKYGRFSGNGFQGSEGQLENWLSKFPMGKNQKIVYKNLISYNNNNIWKVNVQNIFAKKVKNEIISIGDRVICKPIEQVVSKQTLALHNINITNRNVKLRFYDRAKVVSGGEQVGLKKGSIASFEEKYLEKYNLWGKEYFIIKQSRIMGKWV